MLTIIPTATTLFFHLVNRPRWLAITLLASTIAHGVEPPREIRFTSTVDGTEQPAMFFTSGVDHPVPLLVVLHTWSGDFRQRNDQAACFAWCQKSQWAYIHPDFRGPNRSPEATGSELVVQDIADAVAYAQEAIKIDPKQIYLVGTSGGGYTALLMAGRRPDLWAGVSAWVPICDLEAWYHETKQAGRHYYIDIAASCGGPPDANEAVQRQYRLRSPLTYLSNARNVRLDINAGIRDGHEGSVPVSHSLRAFNAVANAEHRLTKEEVAYFVKHAKVPTHLVGEDEDPSYGEKQPLFRRSSGQARITIFDGGHEIVPTAALAWLENRSKSARPLGLKRSQLETQ